VRLVHAERTCYDGFYWCGKERSRADRRHYRCHATNAVMAECLPEYRPVILMALEAMLETRFTLRGVLCSTHVLPPCSS
jgi:hypothetical protein